MSNHVNYFSFSPSRADKQWSHFREDIKNIAVMRKRNSARIQEFKEREEDEKDKQEVNAEVQPLVIKFRTEVFKYFNSRGYVIPGVEWDKDLGTDESGRKFFISAADKMHYLLGQRPVFPRGVNPHDENAPRLFFQLDAFPPYLQEMMKELDEKIENLDRQKIQNRRRERAKNVPISKEDSAIIFSEKLANLEGAGGLDYLGGQNSFDYENLISDLKILDVYYGSVEDGGLDDREGEDTERVYVKALIKMYELESEHDLPTREAWIKVFEKLTKEKIMELAEQVKIELGWSLKEAEKGVVCYLKGVRPVVKDLKETPDAAVVRRYEGEDFEFSQVTKSLLLERAKKHAEEYKGLLPPVL